jgi:hypothetical protein
MKALLFLCVFASFAVPRHEAFGQTSRAQEARKPGEEKAPIPPAPVQTYASSELDRTLENLPPNFKGHDVSLVYSVFEERKKESEKSELETTEQWHQRQETLLLKPIIGRMTTGSIWTFVIDDIRSVYDADNQVLQVYVPLHEMLSSGRLASNFRSMWAKFESTDSSYVGTNGFGAIAEVHNTRYTIHHVAFGNAQAFATAEDEFQAQLQVRVPSGPDAARQMKPEVSALAVCRLTAPFTTSTYDSDAATVSRPYATQSRDNYVMTELLEVWIFDRKSGVIHAKLKPHD